MSYQSRMKDEALTKVGHGLDQIWRRARVTDDYAQAAKESGYLTADVADEIHVFVVELESRARDLEDRVVAQLPPAGHSLG
jgi:hypothetical protein